MGYSGRSAGLITGLAALVLGIGVLAVSAPACRAQDASPGQTTVARVDLIDADLQYAISLLKAQTGVQIVMESSDKPFGHVTMSLEGRSLDFVLKSMCRAAGASLRYQDGVYIIGPKDAAPVVEPVPVKADAEPVEPKKNYKPRLEKIRLQYSRPSEILYLLGLNQGFLNDLEHELIYKQFGQAQNPWRNVDNRFPTIQSLMNPGPGAPPVVPTASPTPAGQENQRQGPGSEAGQGFGGIGGGGLGGGIGGGRGGGGLGGLGGGGGGLGGRGGGGGGGGQALLPDPAPEAIVGYDLDNSILIKGSDEAIREMKNLISLLDIAPKQVMIKAEFVTVSQNDLKNFGIDWTLSRGNLTAGNSGFSGGPVYLNFASGNIVAQLRTTLTEGKGRLINSPMATTLNNVPVQVTVGRTIPVFITQPIAAGNGTVVLGTSLIPIPVFTGITVIPRINGDESISMFVTPFVTDVVDTVTGPDGTTAPVLTQQVFPVNRRIRNGETMVIGGLIAKNDQQSIRKVPLLGDLPLIGNLFTARSLTVADSELLVFITPSIIRDTVPGGGVSSAGSSVTP